MHESSYQKMEKFVKDYLDPNQELKILDMGSCDVNGTYKKLFDNPKWNYTGCDIADGSNVDMIMLDPYKIPMGDEIYDVVISGSTLEHVEYFWVWIKEVVRVLKKGGLVCMIAPGTGVIHPTPVDCWRFLPEGMDALIHWAELEKLETYIDTDCAWWDCVLIAKR